MPTYVAVFALVLAYLALVTAYLALRTLARLRRATSVLARGGDGSETILEATERHAEMSQRQAEMSQRQAEMSQRHAEAAGQLAAEVAALRQDVATLADRPLPALSEQTPTEADGALRNIALVRYDAFDEMAGRMSFSLALLDDAGDGVTVSAITGRNDTRVYAKGITGGRGEHELSPEEQQAVSAALHRNGRDNLATRLVRRRAS